ncbi:MULTISPECIES: hypothetical protein [unclassified Kitasatospora]|uniref:hypothetical protein n=1 Tax=unclassified Kitasatospora TaxID=2633591 RepID=UPI000709E4DE|nr:MULTISPECIES: hypothetical protein [unclassified Kitasatospora]KQV15327.1 hypothetical protein ASC99_06875 [Kitasatospora sp. Root107]KRB64085.1 hypothetical protein ASE03_05980 [Kitasatospora sp. Root187]
MNITLPLVLVLGGAAYAAIKLLGIRLWVAALIALFGFYLAGTFLAPVIDETTRSGVNAVTEK